MRSRAERENRTTFGSLTFTGTLAGGAYTGTTVTLSGAATADSLVLSKDTGKGIKVDTTTPTYPWHDQLGAINVRATGPTAPAYTAYIGSIYAFAFDRAGMQEAFVEFHVVHDYAPGTDWYIHAHWSTSAAPTGDVNWLFECAYAKGYDQEAFAGTSGVSGTITTGVTQAASTAFYHMIAEVQMSAPDGRIASAVNVSITSGTPTLTAASALWTAADIGRTVAIAGAGVAGGYLNTTITAFTSTTQVTLAANASTTVTAQPAFNYRVLDSNRIEVDGVILVRCWRDATRTADTINVTPFLHFCDAHYQSTGIGTKQRNGPAFYT